MPADDVIVEDATTDVELLDDEAIHTWFGLTYANYLVMPRALLQSMPSEWQRRFVAMLSEFEDAFSHVERPEGYRVEAAREVELDQLTRDERRRLGITKGRREGVYYDERGQEHDGWHRTMVPVDDPVPHYNRGRTHVPRKDEIGG